MNPLTRFRQQISNILFLAMFLPAFAGLLAFIFVNNSGAALWVTMFITLIVFVSLFIILYRLMVAAVRDPIEKVAQAIWHISPTEQSIAAPKLDEVFLGRELVSSLAMQIYDLAGGPANLPKKIPVNDARSLLNVLPTPLFILDRNQYIIQTNQAAAQYLHTEYEDLIGKHIYDVLRLSFKTEDTFDKWLKYVSDARATDSKTWEQVRLHLDSGKTRRQFDLAATFSKDNPNGNEVAMVLFDKTVSYDHEDDGLSFVAMAVHELRTPLTIMRGYIEVFEEELGANLNPQQKEFMRKMSASSQTLSSFVNNILNVAKIDQNQMLLTLQEGNWKEILQEIVGELELRASVRGKTIELDIRDELPTVAIDKISMYEVVSNLVENAIKYSGSSKKIIIHVTNNPQGTVDTEVQDFGIGIPDGVVDNLFAKYYRSHRTKNAVGGSGLGLYLVKSIVEAHGGNVWVNSKEGVGSVFGFSLQSFKSAKELPTNNQEQIERHASGWIKNHSMYRR